WTACTALVLFGIIKATIGLRVTKEEELIGLDIGEHGMEAYAGFEMKAPSVNL
ncbi:MAG TPA: ammonium transporter, partial [Bacteroidales bacterium]|nr:ammonium transporter [Bacteroidales bacterium]